MTEFRSTCPIARTLDLLGDKWTLIVLRDLFFGACYFDDFSKSPEGIATNILGDRLKKLERDGFVARAKDENDGRRVRYALTDRGKGLKPLLIAVARWGLENIEGSVAKINLPRSER